jgi:very-short-patch-repair endonuclease
VSDGTSWDRLARLRERLPSDAVFACSTAAWMHGLRDNLPRRAEVFLPTTTSRRSHTAVIVRRGCLMADEVSRIKGLIVTSLHRTLRDICLFEHQIEALIAIDVALHKQRTDKTQLLEDRVTAAKRRGARRLRRMIELAEPAESPMETRLRWLLISHGLPRPQVQVDVCDAAGRFVGRADLFYPEARLVIEYDGGNHRDRLVSDDQRQNLIINAGFRILRFTGPDVYNRSEVVVAQVRGAIASPRSPRPSRQL